METEKTWRAFDLVFFDCDSTLTRIEGIDELARLKGLFNEVKRLTDAAMDGEVHLSSVYDRRLNLLRPTRAEIRDIERLYRASIVPDTRDLIGALHFLERQVFVVSGGLAPAVIPFGVSLGVPRGHIRAVDVVFDRLSGRWWDYNLDRTGVNPSERYLNHDAGPLIETHGNVLLSSNITHEMMGLEPGEIEIYGYLIEDQLSHVIDLVLDPGEFEIVGESTIVRLTDDGEPEVLREGAGEWD